MKGVHKMVKKVIIKRVICCFGRENLFREEESVIKSITQSKISVQSEIEVKRDF